MNSKRRIWFILGLVLPFAAFGASQSQPAAIAPKFAYTIPVAAVHARLAPGYFLLITSVRGDRPQFEPGGTYLIQGTCRVGPERGHVNLVAKLDQGGPILVTFLDANRTRETLYILDRSEAAVRGIALNETTSALNITTNPVPSDDYRAWNGSTTWTHLTPSEGSNARPLP